MLHDYSAVVAKKTQFVSTVKTLEYTDGSIGTMLSMIVIVKPNEYRNGYNLDFFLK